MATSTEEREPWRNVLSWEIVDANGVIHSGGESEMRLAFSIMGNSEEENMALVENGDISDTTLNFYSTDWNNKLIVWTGDLKLVQVHALI